MSADSVRQTGEGKQIAPFQTWRNTNTQEAADELTDLFQFNIPLRWSVAYLYQRILDQEAHVRNLDYVATLSAYIHWKLTGERVIGIGDAAGMFPIDSETLDYNEDIVQKFDRLTKKISVFLETQRYLPEGTDSRGTSRCPDRRGCGISG